MQPVKVKENIYWVGGIDWDLRDFHGYKTLRGSTYNAYLIIDGKITLVDTVKHYLYDEMIERISKIVDPAEIHYIVSNHVEMDHSGGLPRLMEVAKNAAIVTSPKGEQGLTAHYKRDWKFEVVQSGDALELGKHSINFVQTPMVHWPDNMVGYMPEEKILFSNDAFGQHLASSERFDDQFPLHITLEEAQKYYANIVLPYSMQVGKALEALKDLDIKIIAPSHGLIWRSHLPEILAEYKKWADNEVKEKAVIVYDSMWGSTKKMAYAIGRSFDEKGIAILMRDLKISHISDIMTDIIDAKYICVGSPTLNNNMLPTVAAFLTYLKGLAPKKRFGLAFGSYGWGGQSIGQVEEMLKNTGCEMLPSIKLQYVPSQAHLDDVKKRVNEALGSTSSVK